MPKQSKSWMSEVRVCPTCDVEFVPQHFRQQYHNKRCQYIAERRRTSAFGRRMSREAAIKWYGEAYDAWGGAPHRHARYMKPGQRNPVTGEIKT